MAFCSSPHRVWSACLLAAFFGLASTMAIKADSGQPATAPGPTQAPAVSDDDAEAAKAEALTVKLCTECHERDQIVAVRRTPREWKDMITTMVNKGAIGSPAEFTAIRVYLTRYVGIVPVNTAVAADLAAVLGLSAKDADAVVAYRTANGKFADLDALARVPGLDAGQLQAAAESLRFD